MTTPTPDDTNAAIGRLLLAHRQRMRSMSISSLLVLIAVTAALHLIGMGCFDGLRSAGYLALAYVGMAFQCAALLGLWVYAALVMLRVQR